MTRRLAIAAAFLLLALARAGAETGAGPAVETEQARLRLISAVAAAGDLATLPLGVEIALRPGWKTYWRQPGDAGFPPEIALLPGGTIATAALRFPVPHRFSLFGLETFGYGETVVLPLAARPQRPGEPARLRLHLRYLVCKEICIPYEHDLALDLPAGKAAPSDLAPLYNRFAALVPQAGGRIGWSLREARVAGDRLELSLASGGAPFVAPDLVVEAAPGLAFAKPAVTLREDGRSARLVASIERGPNAPDPAATPLTLTVFDGERAMEQTIVAGSFVADAAAPAAPGEESPGLSWFLAAAFLGGLILNVMPCVLPVLLLKLTAILERRDWQRARLRRSFLAGAAGILASFLLLAAALIAIKGAGVAIGWGMQFQQPWFLASLAGICLLCAANAWGWFELRVPAIAGPLAASGVRLGERSPLLGAFLDGVLAAVLATPCSAPFVGAALGFALARGPVEILAILALLGLGLAFPYLAIAAFPGAVAWLPRPGPWMVWLKRALGLSLAGVAFWLLLILAGERGWLARAVPPPADDAVAWQSFDPDRIGREVAAGKIVLVDVTADWCLTCRVNRELVLDRAPLRDRLAAPDILALEADWTRPDERIAAYLASFGRYGIPFAVVYGPRAPAGIALPELLTSTTVLAAIRQAGG